MFEYLSKIFLLFAVIIFVCGCQLGSSVSACASGDGTGSANVFDGIGVDLFGVNGGLGNFSKASISSSDGGCMTVVKNKGWGMFGWSESYVAVGDPLKQSKKTIINDNAKDSKNITVPMLNAPVKPSKD